MNSTTGVAGTPGDGATESSEKTTANCAAFSIESLMQAVASGNGVPALHGSTLINVPTAGEVGTVGFPGGISGGNRYPADGQPPRGPFAVESASRGPLEDNEVDRADGPNPVATGERGQLNGLRGSADIEAARNGPPKDALTELHATEVDGVENTGSRVYRYGESDASRATGSATGDGAADDHETPLTDQQQGALEEAGPIRPAEVPANQIESTRQISQVFGGPSSGAPEAGTSARLPTPAESSQPADAAGHQGAAAQPAPQDWRSWFKSSNSALAQLQRRVPEAHNHTDRVATHSRPVAGTLGLPFGMDGAAGSSNGLHGPASQGARDTSSSSDTPPATARMVHTMSAGLSSTSDGVALAALCAQGTAGSVSSSHEKAGCPILPWTRDLPSLRHDTVPGGSSNGEAGAVVLPRVVGGDSPPWMRLIAQTKDYKRPTGATSGEPSIPADLADVSKQQNVLREHELEGGEAEMNEGEEVVDSGDEAKAGRKVLVELGKGGEEEEREEEEREEEVDDREDDEDDGDDRERIPERLTFAEHDELILIECLGEEPFAVPNVMITSRGVVTSRQYAQALNPYQPMPSIERKERQAKTGRENVTLKKVRDARTTRDYEEEEEEEEQHREQEERAQSPSSHMEGYEEEEFAVEESWMDLRSDDDADATDDEPGCSSRDRKRTRDEQDDGSSDESDDTPPPPKRTKVEEMEELKRLNDISMKKKKNEVYYKLQRRLADLETRSLLGKKMKTAKKEKKMMRFFKRKTANPNVPDTSYILQEVFDGVNENVDIWKDRTLEMEKNGKYGIDYILSTEMRKLEDINFFLNKKTRNGREKKKKKGESSDQMLIKWTAFPVPTWSDSNLRGEWALKELARRSIILDFLEHEESKKFANLRAFKAAYPNRYLSYEKGVEGGYVTHPRALYHNRIRATEHCFNVINDLFDQCWILVVDWTDKQEEDELLRNFEYMVNNIVSDEVHTLMGTNPPKRIQNMKCGNKCTTCKHWILEGSGVSFCCGIQESIRMTERVPKFSKDKVPPSQHCPFRVECTSECACNPNLCCNRVVQRGRQKELCIFRHYTRDFSLYSLSEFKAHEFILEFVGEVKLTRGTGEARLFEVDLDWKADLGNGEKCSLVVNSAKKGNEARFIKHSCHPNCYYQTTVVAREGLPLNHAAILAHHDIVRGEELTVDFLPEKTLENVLLEDIERVFPDGGSCDCSDDCRFPKAKLDQWRKDYDYDY